MSLTVDELTEKVRSLLVGLAHPAEEGFCEVPVLEVEGWPGLPLDGWGLGDLPVCRKGSTPETYGHDEARVAVAALWERANAWRSVGGGR